MLNGNASERQERLPSEAHDFIGRTAELRRVQALLRDNRLVSLVGPGGVGKTRVALRAAAQASAGYRDGVCVVPLSALRDPELLPHTVASRLGLPEQSPGSQLDAVLTHLRDRHLLLVLDTCEHIIDSCAIFAEAIITEAPSVTVLVTSREPLDVTGESCYTLPALGLPDDDSPGQGPTDAIELFAQRAAAVVGGFAVTDANRADVVRLCTRLDGMPLAIELAAVQLRALPLKELADRLDKSLDRRLSLLTGEGGQGRDGRHRTLRDAIGWSYELCTLAEQALWARLSVFAGSFGVYAVEEVCASGDLGRGQIFDTVVRLVDKSVITRDDAGSGEPTRYKMLDTIREYGAERLAEAGTVADVRNRFIARYLSMARYFDEHVVDDDQLDRLWELRREHPNLRAALEYTLDATESESSRYRDGAELATALYGYWHMSGLLREGKYWLDKVLDRFADPLSLERGWALVVRGYLGAMQGEADEAVADATAGTEIGLARDDLKLVGRGYTYLTLALTIADRYDDARAAGAQAEQPLQTLDDRAGLRILDVHLAHVANLSGDIDAALHYAQQVTRRFGESGELGESGASGQATVIKERWAQGWAYAIAALALFWDPERDAETARTASKALLAKHELGDVVGMAYCLELHGWLADRADRHRRAAWLLGAADPLWERAGGRLGGTAALLQVHVEAIIKTRTGLGGKRFESVFAGAGRQPLEQMVAFAVSDADEPAPDGARWRVPGQLTFREAEIADLAARGMTNRQIAEHLFISKRTVDAHLDHIYAKLGISSRVELLNALQWAHLGRA